MPEDYQGKRNRKAADLTSPESLKVTTMNIEQLANIITAMEKSLGEKIDSVKLEINALTVQTTKIGLDVDALKLRNEDVEARLNILEQERTMKGFSLTGFPFMQTGTKNFEDFQKIFTAVGVIVTESDFQKKPFYVGNRDRVSSRIVGSFYCLKKRDDCYTAFNNYRKTKPLLLGEVANLQQNSAYAANEIRFRSDLTPYFKDLLGEARTFKHLFKYAWESNGRILLKTDDTAKPVEIRTKKHLADVVKRLTK